MAKQRHQDDKPEEKLRVEWVDENKKVLGRKRRRRHPVTEKICALNQRMESTGTLAAEWFSSGGDDGAAGCLCVDVCLGEERAVQRHSE